MMLRKKYVIVFEGIPGPTFKEKLHDMAFGVGDTVVLRAVVAGPPAPSVVWYKNEELLHDGNRLKVEIYKLLLSYIY